MNHFCEIDGYLRFENFAQLPINMEVVVVSSESEDGSLGTQLFVCHTYMLFLIAINILFIF